MPKRKRDAAPADPIERKRIEIREHLLQSQKLLQRALKTPKGFARQKLGKRLQNAKAKGVEGLEDRKRINREIEALKGLDVEKMAENYLCRTICKVKRMAESETLPQEIKEKAAKKEGEGEDLAGEMITARNNVTSGMLKTPSVQVVLGEVMRGLYMVMGIPMPEKQVKAKGAAVATKYTKVEPKSDQNITNEMKAIKIKQDASISDSGSWKATDSAGEEGQQPSKRRKAIEGEQGSDYDSDSLSKYEGLLGSSDSESDSEESSFKRPKISSHTEGRTLELSLSPSPPPQRERKSKSKSAKPPPTKKTTFLPTLLGGYFSGSESDGSDIEDLEVIAPVVRKNRPGQMARRAIAEKKFGTGANHIKLGLGSVAEVTGRDQGWDAKKGAQEKAFGHFKRGHGRGQGGRDFGGSGRTAGATGENAGPLGDRARGLGKKDDAGVLHASWQAAKKAKDLQKTAKFEGKKVTF